jgi:hypothetical protein
MRILVRSVLLCLAILAIWASLELPRQFIPEKPAANNSDAEEVWPLPFSGNDVAVSPPDITLQSFSEPAAAEGIVLSTDWYDRDKLVYVNRTKRSILVESDEPNRCLTMEFSGPASPAALRMQLKLRAIAPGERFTDVQRYHVLRRPCGVDYGEGEVLEATFDHRDSRKHACAVACDVSFQQGSDVRRTWVLLPIELDRSGEMTLEHGVKVRWKFGASEESESRKLIVAKPHL